MKNEIHYIDKAKISEIYSPRESGAHKGSQGHVLLIGGSYGKMGSMCLSSKAALRTGCGLLTALVPACGYTILQTVVPEAMVLTDADERIVTNIVYDIKVDAIGIGPGLGFMEQTQRAFHEFLKSNVLPLVVDADGLNMLAMNREWLFLLPKGTILTPHLMELERLLGHWKNDREMMELVSALSLKHDLVVVVKGAPTRIVDGASVYINTTGNPGLATAGTGDVLTGMTSSLRGQGYQALESALLGVFLHGMAADLAVKQMGMEALMAGDLEKFIGTAYLSLL